MLSLVSQPNARTNTVAGNLRLRSIRTATTSLASVSSSIHAPRLGITVESYKRLPIVSISGSLFTKRIFTRSGAA